MDTSKSQDERLFRQYEQQLDKRHREMPLFAMNAGQALIALLSVYDRGSFFDFVGMANLYTESPTAPQLNAGERLDEKYTEDGLSQALQWIDPTNIGTPLKLGLDKSTIVAASKMLTWASGYVSIADAHKAKGQGILSVSVDEANKQVAFAYGSDNAARSALRNMAIASRTSNRDMRDIEQLSEQDAGELLAIIDDISEIVDGRIVIDPAVVFDRIELTRFSKLLGQSHVFTLSDSDQIGEFCTMAEFRKFVIAIKAWSVSATFAFITKSGQRLMGKGRDIGDRYFAPTQIMPVEEFYRVMASVTGLDIGRTKTIAALLSYDDRTSWTDIFLQPLITVGHEICWSTTVVQNSSMDRNLLRLLARTKATKKVADNLIGGRARELARLVGKHLQARCGYQFKLEVEVNSGGEEGDIDLLAYSTKYPSEVLIVECKAILAADEIVEVAAATKEMKKGQSQLRKISRILGRLSNEEKTKIFPFVNWSAVENTFHIVMTSDTEPGVGYDMGEIPAISFQALKLLFDDRQLRRPGTVYRRIRNEPWLDNHSTSEVGTTKIAAGNISYLIPVVRN